VTEIGRNNMQHFSMYGIEGVLIKPSQSSLSQFSTLSFCQKEKQLRAMVIST